MSLRDRFLGVPHGTAPPWQPGSLRLLPDDVAGELDEAAVDPAWPRWTSNNLAEAFPGPMTPLSLEISLQAMRNASDAFTQMIPLPADLAAASRCHMLTSIGHTIHVNVGLLAASAARAGQTPEEFEHELFGSPLPPGYRHPRPGPAQLLGLARLGLAMGPRVAALGRTIAGHQAVARRRAVEAADLPHLDEGALLARLDALVTELEVAWAAANLATALVSQPMASLERRFSSEVALAARADVEELASAGAAHGVRTVAAAAARDPRAVAALAAPAGERLARLRPVAPDVAARFDAVIERYGHRGPGETELENPVFADDPDLLLEAVAKLVARDGGGPPTSTAALPSGARRLLRRAEAASLRRERGRDAVVLLTHVVRRTVRELARRLAADGRLAAPEDVHYLRRAELAAVPADAAALVARRRAERDRLRRLALPVVLDGPWTPPVAGPADSLLQGIGASSGTAVGRVRVVQGNLADLEPGEILVARVTDVGWTPFFNVAGAVVTDAGGLMAHAAVVARELGIPAVVGTRTATSVLEDGQLVEVDGAAGTVKVL